MRPYLGSDFSEEADSVVNVGEDQGSVPLDLGQREDLDRDLKVTVVFRMP